jgi:tripartite-type tricarboxylate transporter receptor subunit TctC
VLAVHPSVPAHTVKELIALAKAKPGQLNFGAGGTGPQLTGELFNSMAGTKITFIGYKGGAPATLATMMGEVISRSRRCPPRSGISGPGG